MTGLFIDVSDYTWDPEMETINDAINLAMVEEYYNFYPSKMNTR